MAGGSMKDIKRRIKSVESTKQITKAMELVASSKLRKAKQRALDSAPFLDSLYETICSIATSCHDLKSVYVNSEEIKTELIVVIAGDRGLAGGYNSNILKMATATINENTQKGITTKVLGIGKKSVEFFAKRDCLHKGMLDVAGDIDLTRVKAMSNDIIDLYLKGEVQSVKVFYTKFVSALTQDATKVDLLPLSGLADSTKETSEYLFEPSPELVFDTIIPIYAEGVLYCSIVESFASEQGARRTAMESANDNANEMIDSLSLKYNRARQAAITQEISEIVSGTGALK